MILLGIILILLAVLAGVAGLWAVTSLSPNPDTSPLQMRVGDLFAINVSPAALFISGMVVMALLWLGWWMTRVGTKRSVNRRRERKQLERDAREQEKELAKTQARLGKERESAAEAARRHEEELRRAAAAPPPAGPTGHTPPPPPPRP